MSPKEMRCKNSHVFFKRAVKNMRGVIVLKRGHFRTENPPSKRPVSTEKMYKNATPKTPQPNIDVAKNMRTGIFAPHGMNVRNFTVFGHFGHWETAKVVQAKPNVNAEFSKNEMSIRRTTTVGKNPRSVENTDQYPSMTRPEIKASITYEY
jgi:hypothetical protein